MGWVYQSLTIRPLLGLSIGKRQLRARGGLYRAEQWMGPARLKIAVEHLERAPSTRPIRTIASRPSRGRLPCAARPMVSISTHSKPLCATATPRSVGSVTTAASARQRVTRASAPRLACSSSTTHDDKQPDVEPAGYRENASGTDHGGYPTLHVLRAAPIDSVIAFDRVKRPRHSGNAYRIDVPAKHQRPPGHASLEHADHIGAASRDFLHLDSEAERAELLAKRTRDGGLTGGARDDRGVDGIDCDQDFQQADGGIHSCGFSTAARLSS